MPTFTTKFVVQAIIVLLILVAAFLGYQFFLNRSKTAAAEPGLVRVSTTETISPAADEFLNLLLSLQNITLETKLFNDARFMNLQDFSTSLPNLGSGRLNPFLPASATERPFNFGPAASSSATNLPPPVTSTSSNSQ